MPIRFLLELELRGAVCGPEDIKAIIAGYEAALKRLKVDGRSHVILHTDRNLLSFTIVGIHCMAGGCAYANDWDDGVNRFSILKFAPTSHGRFLCGCATRRYVRRCPSARRRSRSTRCTSCTAL